MKQAVITSPRKVEFREVPVPELKAGDVLVRIMKMGICGSDVHVYCGNHPYVSYPVVQGHEVSGVVERVGEKVDSLRVNDRVTIQPQVVCGECYQCAHGKYHICDNLRVMGFQTEGAASEYFAVDEEWIHKLPEEMSFDYGAMLEPLAVAVHALERGGDVKGKNVLVLGAGPIGNLVAQAAKGLGASGVMVTDLSDYRLEIANECGIDHCVNPSQVKVLESLLGSFGESKADLIVECVGVEATMQQAIELARKGTDIVVAGVFGAWPTVDLGFVQDRELRLIGTLMYQHNDFRTSIDLIRDGKVNLKHLITDHYTFEDFENAYAQIEGEKDKTMKVMIDI